MSIIETLLQALVKYVAKKDMDKDPEFQSYILKMEKEIKNIDKDLNDLKQEKEEIKNRIISSNKKEK